MFVDPEVSKAKFNSEIERYQQGLDENLARGWWLLKAEFPEALFVFAALPSLRPVMVPFGVLINFENYDFWPPSVVLVDPLTHEPYRGSQAPPFLRAVPGQQPQNLLQFETGDSIPFFCIPGVREYHQHPAHSGDNWLLRRGKVEGTLNFILTQIYVYGVKPIIAPRFNLQISIEGFVVGAPSE